MENTCAEKSTWSGSASCGWKGMQNTIAHDEQRLRLNKGQVKETQNEKDTHYIAQKS